MRRRMTDSTPAVGLSGDSGRADRARAPAWSRYSSTVDPTRMRSPGPGRRRLDRALVQERPVGRLEIGDDQLASRERQACSAVARPPGRRCGSRTGRRARRSRLAPSASAYTSAVPRTAISTAAAMAIEYLSHARAADSCALCILVPLTVIVHERPVRTRSRRAGSTHYREPARRLIAESLSSHFAWDRLAVPRRHVRPPAERIRARSRTQSRGRSAR